MLANAARSVGHAFPGQPETEAEVRLALAGTYAALGRFGDARPHAETAHSLLARRHGEASAEAMRALEAVVRRKIFDTIGITAAVSVVPPKTVERSAGKAQRVLDLRK